MDLSGSLQRGARDFHLSPPDEGRERRRKEIKKLRTKKSAQCHSASLVLDKHVCQILTKRGQAKTSDNGGL